MFKRELPQSYTGLLSVVWERGNSDVLIQHEARKDVVMVLDFLSHLKISVSLHVKHAHALLLLFLP